MQAGKGLWFRVSGSGGGGYREPAVGLLEHRDAPANRINLRTKDPVNFRFCQLEFQSNKAAIYASHWLQRRAREKETN